MIKEDNTIKIFLTKEGVKDLINKLNNFLPVKTLVNWPEGTEYLSFGPFF